jgi:hypothetical protein
MSAGKMTIDIHGAYVSRWNICKNVCSKDIYRPNKRRYEDKMPVD